MEKITGDEPIHATIYRQTGDASRRVASKKYIEQGQHLMYEEGLTIRQHFAAMALQGLCVQAISGSHNQLKNMVAELPEKAVALADALIAELNK